jgi:hypothetical protein
MKIFIYNHFLKNKNHTQLDVNQALQKNKSKNFIKHEIKACNLNITNYAISSIIIFLLIDFANFYLKIKHYCI